jgi:hypothetical protein
VSSDGSVRQVQENVLSPFAAVTAFPSDEMHLLRLCSVRNGTPAIGFREECASARGLSADKLEVWSEHKASTEVELTIPAWVAYLAHEEGRSRLLARKVEHAP